MISRLKRHPRTRTPRRAPGSYRRLYLFLEPLEDRLTPSTLIPVTDHRALVFDPTRDLLYITTSSGQVQRYDVDRQALLPAWAVGASLNGADLSPDGSALYVAEGMADTANHVGFIHKVNLDDGHVTDLPFALVGNETGAYEIALNADGTGFLTTAGQLLYDPAGLRQIDLTTDTLSARPDAGTLDGNALLARSADRTQDLFVARTPAASHSFSAFRYDVAGQAFSPSSVVGYTYGFLPAVNRNGSLLALLDGYYWSDRPLRIVDQNLRPVRTLTYVEGAAFDPIQDVLYVADPTTSQVVAYDTNSWQVKYRLDIGEDISSYFAHASPLGTGEMTVSSDGRYLFLATLSGVRLIDLPPATGRAASFGFSGMPTILPAGTTAPFTLTALDPAGNPVGHFTGRVHLSSSDPRAVFLDPATGHALRGNSYVFKPRDHGVKTLAVALATPGTQSLAATGRAGALAGRLDGVSVTAGPPQLLPVANLRAMVFDPTRDLLYVTTADGLIERYDVDTGTLLEPFRVGGSLNAADITPDGRFLYVTDVIPGLTQGLVHKVNLDTGAVTDLAYNLNGLETGSYDIAVEANGKAFFSTQDAGSSPLPLRQIDLTSDTVSDRTLVYVNQDRGALLVRSADRKFAFFFNAATFIPYDAETDSFLPAITINSLGQDVIAANRDGSLLAALMPSDFRVVSVFETGSNRVVHNLTHADGGLAFDPVRDVLYVADPATNRVLAYDTNTWQQEFALDVGGPVAPAAPFGNGTMTLNADGTVLFLATPQGVRVLNLPASTGVASRLSLTGMPTLLPAGTTATFTLTALDPIGDVDTGYAGTVQLSSSDPAAVFLDPATGQALPGNSYTFTPQDHGTKALAVTLATPGAQSIAATDPAGGLAGGPASVTVTAGPVTLLPITNHRGMVFDPTRDLLYVTTSDGTVQRYDVGRQVLLAPFHVGGSLDGADVTTDGQYLYVGEGLFGATQGLVRKVNLDTGAVTLIPLDQTVGSLGLVITNDGKAWATPFETSSAPLYEIDLGTGAVSFPRNIVTSTFAARSADGSFAFFTPGGYFNPSFAYDATTGTFSPSVSLNLSWNPLPAVNRDGSLIAVEDGNGVEVLDRDLNVMHTLDGTGLTGGLTFDPVRKLLYAVNVKTAQVIAYDTDTWQQSFAVPVGEPVSAGTAFGNGEMTVSSDGSWLFLATASGVRVYALNGRTNTGTALAATPASPAQSGQPVAFTATVSGGDPASRQGETVTFLDGQAVLGTGSLNASGQATFTTSSLTVGSHAITALYPGDGGNNPSSTTLTYRVRPPQTATSLSVTTSVSHSPPAFSIATITVAVSGGNPADRAGELVSVIVSRIPRIFYALLEPDGTGSTEGITLAEGTWTLTASYPGDDLYQSSSTTSQVDVPHYVALFLNANPVTGVPRQPVTFTAQLFSWRAPAQGTESVTFLDGDTVLGSGTLNGSGQASFTTSALTAGVHVITAAYAGDDANPAASSSISYQVIPPTTLVTVQSSSGTYATSGQPVTFTATVGGGAPADRQGEPVVFLDGTTVLGEATLDASGQALFTTDALDPGSHTIVAAYAGDDNYHGGVGWFGLIVAARPPSDDTVTLDVSPRDVSIYGTIQIAGRPVTLTASVQGGVGTAGRVGEEVVFSDRGVPLGTATLDGSGQATLTIPGLDPGLHFLTVSYPGDDTSVPGSATVGVQVIPPALQTTGTQLTASPPDRAPQGTPVTLTAAVGNIFQQDLTGLTVTFRDGDQVLAVVPVGADGRATFTAQGLALGTHKIIATLNGNSKYLSSSAEVIYVVQTTATTPTSLALTADPPGPAPAGQAVTFTAAVRGGDVAGRTGERVTFWDGKTLLGSAVLDESGQAVFTSAALVPGRHRITAVFDGDPDALGSSAALDYVVTVGS